PGLPAASPAGDIVDSDGRVLGRHRGQQRFTVGQRRGIGIAATEPLYVLSKDARRNRVVVGPRAGLATHEVAVAPARLHRPATSADSVRLRYHSPSVPCDVRGTAGESPQSGHHHALSLRLAREVRAPAPGQTACLMRDDLVVGWGTVADA
ncbi:MAG: bifunctional Fe-S cluster assembly protein NifU/tRNA 2-thiouridine(34) synthase MnmA, partial [Acidimicrobiia bacterium]|nr:bifunctional Fe-S cluster assembly protein NifU/tRNA 2-thiouridine(34) synthase MnmA [Acidimicrobiia bacterium]